MVAHGLSSRILPARRIIIIVLAICTTLSLSVALFYSSNWRPTYEWLPKPIARPAPNTGFGFAPPPKNPADPDVVELDYISFRPQKDEDVKSFWNIPYAASAGGANRFRGPQPIARKYEGVVEWNGKLGMCPGIQKISTETRAKENLSLEGPDVPGLEAEHTEDCLSLNVFTPIDAEAGDELPVLVNIPGGGFSIPGRANGGPFVAKTRGKNDKGVIVVTMYYRNGIYGFLSGDAIKKDGDFNMALRDQRATLEWIQKYIRYFGGNPDHVVIMGTSAGAASVLLQVTANGGNHSFSTPGSGRTQLFHGAIAQSPAAPTFYTMDQANHFWENVALGVNCTDLSVECVRAASTPDLFWQNYPMSFPGRDTPPRWPWAPTTEPEGGLWTEPAPHAILNGRYAKVPTIMGFTTNEGTDQTKNEIDTEGQFKSYIKDHYPLLTDADLEQLLKNYPNARHWPESGRFWDGVAKAQGDLRYICPTYLTSNAIAAHNPPDVKTWQYQWDVAAEWDMTNGYGTHHATTVGRILSRPANEISDYFISFVKHLDPNVGRDPKTVKWEALHPAKPKRLVFTNRDESGMKKLYDDPEKMRITLEEPDPGREKRCQYVKSLMPRLQT